MKENLPTISTLIFICSLIVLPQSIKSQNYSWAKNIGGSSNDKGNSVATDMNGNVYVTGSFEGTVDFDPSSSTNSLTSNGMKDIFIAKYTSTGAFVWAKKVGGSSTDEGNDIAIDKNGNIYVTGLFMSTVDFDPGTTTNSITSNGNYDIFITKYNQNGVYQWAYGFGSSNWDWGQSVAVDTNGSVYITGVFTNTVDFDPSSGTNNLISKGTTDVFVAKYSSYGNLLNAFSIGSSSAEYGEKIRTDNDCNVYITGSFSSTVDFNPGSAVANRISVGSGDVYLAKYNSSGNYQWAISFGGSSNDLGKSLDIDNYGNVYVTGSFYNTVDFNPSNGVANLTSSGSTDIFIAKYNFMGAYIWAGKIGGTDMDMVNDLSIDYAGNSYITGEFWSTSDFDPSNITKNITPNGQNDIFILKLNSFGNYVWAYNIGGTSEDIGYGITSQDDGTVYVTGYFRNSADFDPSSSNHTLSSNGICDIFLTKLINPNCSLFQATTTSSGSTDICQGSGVVIKANTGAGYSYQWFRDGVKLNNASNYSIYVTAPGDYSVIVSNSYSCIDTSAIVNVTVKLLPVSTISTPEALTFCLGDSIILKANTDTGFSWQWRLNNNDIVGAYDSFFYAKESGNYSATITNIDGCSKVSNLLKVELFDQPDTTVYLSGKLDICQGDSVELMATTDSNLNYQWKKDGLVISGATNSSLFVTHQGNYQLIVSNSFSCIDSSSIKSVIVNPLPNNNITKKGMTTFCMGDSIILKSDSRFNSQWRKDGIDIIGANDSVLLVKSSGIYSCEITSISGCSDTSSGIEITVNNLPNTNLHIIGSLTFCESDSVILLADTSYNLYTWKLDGNIINSKSNSFISAQSQGNYKVIITDSFGCTDSSSEVFVKVNELPNAHIYASTSAIFCLGDSVVLLSDTGFQYQWLKNNDIINDETKEIFVAKEFGEYSVIITNKNQCSDTSNSISVIVNELPEINLGKDTSLCSTSSMVLDAGTGFTTYLWSTGAKTQTIVLDGSLLSIGIHVFWVEITNLNGCSNIDTININVTKCNGIKDEIRNETISLYPNPSLENVSFTFEKLKSKNVCISIVDLSGKTVYQSSKFEIQSDNFVKEIDLRNMLNGYYIAIIEIDGINIQKKIIIL